MSTDDPLLGRRPGEPVDPIDAAHEVRRFLLRCRAWATERELPVRRERLQTSDDPADAAKLHGWLTYIRFLDHTLAELDDGTLDHWFAGEAGSDGGAQTDGLV